MNKYPRLSRSTVLEGIVYLAQRAWWSQAPLPANSSLIDSCFYCLFLFITLTFSTPHSCVLRSSLKLSMPKSVQALLSREHRLRQWPGVSPIHGKRWSPGRSGKHHKQRWLHVAPGSSGVKDKGMCEARRAKTRSQGRHGSCTLYSVTETKPHGEPEMRTPRN